MLFAVDLKHCFWPSANAKPMSNDLVHVMFFHCMFALFLSLSFCMILLCPWNELNSIFSEELNFMLLVTSAVKTVHSISQNGINPITLNEQLGNHLNMDIINASRYNLYKCNFDYNKHTRRGLLNCHDEST
jgi:hypothetical protein